MHPHLFDLFGIGINAYGTLILIGGFLTVPGMRWDALARGLPRARMLSFIVDFWLVLIFGAFFGGRLLHVLTVPGVYASNPAKLVTIDGTGFVFFGSFIAIVIGWIWLSRRYPLSFSALCDLGFTWMPLGHAFGRLGCYFAGCCWGGATNGWSGQAFPANSVVYLEQGAPILGTQTLPLHPTQLYEAAGLFAIWALLLGLRIKRGVEQPWRQASRYAVAYGALRFTVELMRGDATRGFIFEARIPWLAEALALRPSHPLLLTFSQAVALGCIALGAYGLRATTPKGPSVPANRTARDA